MERRLATTRWSLIKKAGEANEDARQALNELCELYWYPLYAFARRDRRDRTAEDAADLTQGFLADILARRDLAGLDPAKGTFRSWLLQSMRHFIANKTKEQRAQKRGGGAVTFSLDAVDAEQRYLHEPVDLLDAEKLYTRRWALTAIHRALEKVKAEVAAGGPRAERELEALKGWLVDDPPEGGYAKLAVELGTTAVALRARVHRWRRTLRAEIADTMGIDENVDGEIKQLIDALT